MAHNIKTGKRHVLLDIVNVIYTKFPDKVVNHLIDEGIVFKASGGFTVDDRELGKYIEVSSLSQTAVYSLILKLIFYFLR